jgi:hypothetical protein
MINTVEARCMSDGAKTTEQLARLVSAKLQVLKILVQLSQRQINLIDTAEMTDLIKLLTAKQTVLGQLQALERELEPYRGDDPDQRVWSSLAARAACQAQAHEANALLAQLLELEQRAETSMLVRRDAAGLALATLQTAADARAAYTPLSTIPLAGLHIEG